MELETLERHFDQDEDDLTDVEGLERTREEEDSDGEAEEGGGSDSDLIRGGMPKKSKARSPNPRTVRQDRPDSSDSTAVSPTSNGHPRPSADGSMNGSFRERAGKHHSIDDDGDSTRATTRLMHERSFSLDHTPPHSPSREKGSVDGDGEAKGFWELSVLDRRNFLLLVLLYFLQGIPMGLAHGSVPFLLKSHMSYGQIGVFSLATYPYSLKLLWSPIVDAVWSAKVGRRKSWILPIQMLSGLGMIWLGTHAQQMMEQAGENGGAGVWGFTAWWFALVFMCATQDIAVDGMCFLFYLAISS